MEDKPNPNPYAAPSAPVLSAATDEAEDSIAPNGRQVPIGNGVQWISDGWTLFTQSPLMWILNIVILFAIGIVLGFIPFLGNVASNLLTPIFGAGLALAAHGLMRGRPVEVGDLFKAFSTPQIGSLVLLGVLYMAAVITLTIIAVLLFMMFIGVSGGFSALFSSSAEAIMTKMMAGALMSTLLVVLIVMAISIPVLMAFWFAPALVVIGKLSPAQALSTSFWGCLKNFLPFLLYGLVFLVLFIVGAIPLGLGLLVVFPLMITSSYSAFRDIYLGRD